MQAEACYNVYKIRSIINYNNLMTSINQLCAQLKAQGRRITPQRRAIIRVLLENGAHPTAEQVLTRVRDTMPDLSPATVYNTLHELVEIGALQELHLGLGERHYHITTTDHAHLVCLRCGRVEDVPQDCEALVLPREHTHGFQLVDCNVVFRGYCPACASQEESLDGGSMTSQQEETTMEKWECLVCGYVYDPAEGDPDNGVEPGTPFEDLPDDWVCPDCGAGKDMFEKMG